MKKTIHTAEHALFCRMLVAERRKRRLTQAGLAAALGRPQSFVAKIERGERRLDVVEFLEVARVIGFNVSRFLAKLAAGGG